MTQTAAENRWENDGIQSALTRIGRIGSFRENVGSLMRSSRKRIAFIQFDISRFKLINDLYGEKFGDEVLEFIVSQLAQVCCSEQFFVNLRSDVFMIVTEYEKEEELTALIHELMGRISHYKDVKLQMSYGVYTVEDRGMELRQMQDRASMARCAAKDNMLTDIVFYEEQLKEALYNLYFIEEHVETAIAKRQFILYLQPKFSIVRNKIIGAEALVRWQSPEKGMLYPDQFIPVIEENGFIKKLDYYVWEESCRFLRKCMDAGVEPCPVSVNMSRIHLKGDECMQVLSEMMERNAVPKHLLELEITESSDNQQIGGKAQELKREGFTLLMDDFGSGYSSLNILMDTPFDMIKLDKKFMEKRMMSGKGKLILEQMVAMAKKLDIGLLAEGVETKEQIELLRSIGCDQVQGYYYAKPMPADEFLLLLKEQAAG